MRRCGTSRPRRCRAAAGAAAAARRSAARGRAARGRRTDRRGRRCAAGTAWRPAERPGAVADRRRRSARAAGRRSPAAAARPRSPGRWPRSTGCLLRGGASCGPTASKSMRRAVGTKRWKSAIGCIAFSRNTVRTSVASARSSMRSRRRLIAPRGRAMRRTAPPKASGPRPLARSCCSMAVGASLGPDRARRACAGAVKSKPASGVMRIRCRVYSRVPTAWPSWQYRR